jgi:hypothetical protein
MIILGLVTGLVVGGLGAGFIAGVVSYSVLKFEERRLQRGWNLVPAVVAARDLAPGQKVSLDAIAQRSIPEQFLTSSVVKPDSAAYVKDQMLIGPLSAGDPLYWGAFSAARPLPGPESASRGASAVWEACHAALGASPAAPKYERSPADIRARLAREGGR